MPCICKGSMFSLRDLPTSHYLIVSGLPDAWLLLTDRLSRISHSIEIFFLAKSMCCIDCNLMYRDVIAQLLVVSTKRQEILGRAAMAACSNLRKKQA